MKPEPAGGVICGLLALVFSVDICQGKIITFSVSRVSDEGCSLIHNDVVLACDVDDDSSTIAIKRLKDGALLGTSRAGEKSLKHVIYNVSCSDMGTYECLLDNTERLTADLVIVDCPLQLCDGAAVNRTMFVGVGDPVRVSFCVLACYNIDPNAEFNDSLVRRKSQSIWTWDYEPITSAGLPTTRFHVYVRLDAMVTDAYGLLNVRIFSHLGPLNYLDFHIMLHTPGHRCQHQHLSADCLFLGKITLSSLPLLFELPAHIPRAVFPCSKHNTQFRNRTLLARMGGTVSFAFCAESSVRVFERVNISHANHRSGWYPLPAGVEETLEVQVRIRHHIATVIIEVNKLQPADFNEPFAVTLFAADENGTRVNDTSTFFFVIEDTDFGGTTQLLTDLRHTTPGCAEQSDGSRRHGMCHVIQDICLTVIAGNRNLTLRDQCAAENSSHVADFNSIEILKPCLTDLLQLSLVKIVRLGETRYTDIRNWTEVHPQSPNCVPCLIAKQQLADPVITWFTLQLWDDNRETILWQQNFLDRNNTSVTIPATTKTLNVTCQASGYPTPEVVIIRDNEALEMLPDGISLQLNHTFYGEFICQATNVLKSGPTNIRVLVLPTAGSDIGGSPPQAVRAVVGGSVAAVLVIIIIVVFICLLRRKENIPEAQAPEIPHYEEIIDFHSDMPDNPIYYENLILSTKHNRGVEYENTVCGLHDT